MAAEARKQVDELGQLCTDVFYDCGEVQPLSPAQLRERGGSYVKMIAAIKGTRHSDPLLCLTGSGGIFSIAVPVSQTSQYYSSPRQRTLHTAHNQTLD